MVVLLIILADISKWRERDICHIGVNCRLTHRGCSGRLFWLSANV